MPYKNKSIPFANVKLHTHPLLGELIKHDVTELKVNLRLDEIPVDVMQTLLDLHPLPVTPSTDRDHYLTLAPSGLLERFRAL